MHYLVQQRQAFKLWWDGQAQRKAYYVGGIIGLLILIGAGARYTLFSLPSFSSVFSSPVQTGSESKSSPLVSDAAPSPSLITSLSPSESPSDSKNNQLLELLESINNKVGVPEKTTVASYSSGISLVSFNKLQTQLKDVANEVHKLTVAVQQQEIELQDALKASGKTTSKIPFSSPSSNGGETSDPTTPQGKIKK